MAAFGAVVLGQAFYRARHPEAPVVELIGSFGLLALVANGLCLALLWRHRDDDINMSSVWLCSRNDIIANVSVLVAAVGVWWTGSAWPDIIVGTALAALFFKSSVFVVRVASLGLRAAPSHPTHAGFALGVAAETRSGRSLRGRRRRSEASVNSRPIFRLFEARSGRYATKTNGKSGRSGAAAACRSSAAQTPNGLRFQLTTKFTSLFGTTTSRRMVLPSR